MIIKTPGTGKNRNHMIEKVNINQPPYTKASPVSPLIELGIKGIIEPGPITSNNRVINRKPKTASCLLPDINAFLILQTKQQKCLFLIKFNKLIFAAR